MTPIQIVNHYGVIRRLVLAVAICMTWEVSRWSMAYATGNAARPGLETAAVLAAVQAPITLFAGSVFRAYLASRSAA
ncbi:hypothetical protein [Rhodocyclus tenuis]|uniref:Uncharacterized protein n=1 Tax=Rhodocyclus tenuis TaxID=1066 RepID=A0A840G940_RHOTE|nr:hypothetical protein [Rhodocyclus tenuis]MBB4248366.1 hypothetical protein [Rhodocyclus tenuis]